MRTVRLYGVLGKMFGRVHRFDILTPAEAVKALCANFPEFYKYLANNPRAPYRVLVADEAQGFDQLGNPFGAKESFKIIPVAAGAGGNGFGQIIIGGLLIASMFAFPGVAAIGLWGKATVGSVIASVGVSLIIGGVVQMLTGTPSSNSKQNTPVPENPSYSFSGAVNTTAQGNPVPICYGELIVGSAVISSGLDIR